MSIQKKLESALMRVQHHPERYAEGIEERILSVMAKRKIRNSKIWKWRYMQQDI